MSSSQGSRSSSESGEFDDDIVISYHDATLRRVDLQTLEDEEWLNDAVIAFCYEVLSRQFPQLSFWPPAVAELLCTLSREGGVSQGKDSMDQLLPKETPGAFIPVSDKFGDPNGVSSHWTCLYSVQAPAHGNSSRLHQGAHFDSMAPANAEAGLFTYDALAKARGAHAKTLVEVDVPAQANASDCGLYVILLPLAYLLSRGREASTDEIPSIAALQETAAKLTPPRVAAFRADLRAWLNRWAEVPRKRQLKLTSWHAIEQTVGRIDVRLE